MRNRKYVSSVDVSHVATTLTPPMSTVGINDSNFGTTVHPDYMATVPRSPASTAFAVTCWRKL